MNSSLIISTYNRVDTLNLTLKSVTQQVTMPNEVIVADDGSTEETKQCVEEWRSKFPCALVHCWHEDKGFRLAHIRNRAINVSQGEYIISIDGDVILHPKFIADHLSSVQPKRFIQGSRVLLSEGLTSNVLKEGRTSFKVFEGGMNNRINALHSQTLKSILSREVNHLKSIRGCNMSFWKRDLQMVNGFNEEIEGWGREDTELVVRLFNSGIRRFNLKGGGIMYHLFHHEANKTKYKDVLKRNDSIVKKSINEKLVRCERGLS